MDAIKPSNHLKSFVNIYGANMLILQIKNESMIS